MSAFVRETPKAPTFEARFVFFVVPANTDSKHEDDVQSAWDPIAGHNVIHILHNIVSPT